MASQAPTPTPSQRKTLLHLPAELRNLIFEDVVNSPTPIQLLSPTWRESRGFCASLPSLRLAPEPAAAQICKSLRAEVLSTYYSINTFHIGRVPFRKPSFQNVHTHEQYVSALRQWRGRLRREPAARFLKDVEVDLVLSVRHERRASCFYDQAFSFYAKMMADGRLSYRLTDSTADFCLCGLRPAQKPEDGEILDGRCLVDAALDICQSLYPSVQEVHCGRCGLTRLIRANYLLSCFGREGEGF